MQAYLKCQEIMLISYFTVIEGKEAGIDLERLPFVWKTRKFQVEFKWNGSSQCKNFQKKSNTFRGITFFPFSPKQPKFSVPFVWITSARVHVERK